MLNSLKRLPIFILLPMTLLASDRALGQQTYLHCIVPPEKKTPELNLDFTLDESAGTVSFYWANLHSVLKQRAVFTADKVIWTQPFYLGTTIRRTVDRVTLEYTDELLDGRKTSTTKGLCTVVPAPAERKF